MAQDLGNGTAYPSTMHPAKDWQIQTADVGPMTISSQHIDNTAFIGSDMEQDRPEPTECIGNEIIGGYGYIPSYDGADDTLYGEPNTIDKKVPRYTPLTYFAHRHGIPDRFIVDIHEFITQPDEPTQYNTSYDVVRHRFYSTIKRHNDILIASTSNECRDYHTQLFKAATTLWEKYCSTEADWKTKYPSRWLVPLASWHIRWAVQTGRYVTGGRNSRSRCPDTVCIDHAEPSLGDLVVVNPLDSFENIKADNMVDSKMRYKVNIYTLLHSFPELSHEFFTHSLVQDVLAEYVATSCIAEESSSNIWGAIVGCFMPDYHIAHLADDSPPRFRHDSNRVRIVLMRHTKCLPEFNGTDGITVTYRIAEYNQMGEYTPAKYPGQYLFVDPHKSHGNIGKITNVMRTDIGWIGQWLFELQSPDVVSRSQNWDYRTAKNAYNMYHSELVARGWIKSSGRLNIQHYRDAALFCSRVSGLAEMGRQSTPPEARIEKLLAQNHEADSRGAADESLEERRRDALTDGTGEADSAITEEAARLAAAKRKRPQDELFRPRGFSRGLGRSIETMLTLTQAVIDRVGFPPAFKDAKKPGYVKEFLRLGVYNQCRIGIIQEPSAMLMRVLEVRWVTYQCTYFCTVTLDDMIHRRHHHEYPSFEYPELTELINAPMDMQFDSCPSLELNSDNKLEYSSDTLFTRVTG